MTTKKDEILAVLVEGDSRGFHTCDVCESEFTAEVLAEVPDREGNFTVCPDCIIGDYAEVLLEERADALAHQAKTLRALAGRLKLPSSEELRHAELLVQAVRFVARRRVPLAELLALPAKSQDKLAEAARNLHALGAELPAHLQDDDIPF